jgi:hypothetical protein
MGVTARNGQQSTLRAFCERFDEKKTRQNSITARFMGKLPAGDHLLCGAGSVFLMTCFRALFHEETGGLGASLDHAVGVLLVQGVFRKDA